MRILAIERQRPTPGQASLHDLLRDEAAGVWDLLKRDVIRDLWYTAADPHVIIMLECKNAAEARQHLAALPLVRTGLIDFTLHELRNYDGFERLFTVGGEPVVLTREEPAEY